MKINENNFSKALKRLRKESGMSQAKFAQAVGLNVRTLQSWEIAKSTPPAPHIIHAGLVAVLKEKS